MDIETMWTLKIDDEYINMGEKIKVYLKNGEIIYGTYENSDWVSLTIERRGCDLDIDFKEIKRLKNYN